MRFKHHLYCQLFSIAFYMFNKLRHRNSKWLLPFPNQKTIGGQRRRQRAWDNLLLIHQRYRTCNNNLATWLCAYIRIFCYWNISCFWNINFKRPTLLSLPIFIFINCKCSNPLRYWGVRIVVVLNFSGIFD